MVFLLWNLVKQCKLALKKLHSLSHNSPILSHNLPWKYCTISDFLSHPIRWAVFFSRILRSEALVYNSFFFWTVVLWKLFNIRFSYNTVISQSFAYSSRWRRKLWQGVLVLYLFLSCARFTKGWLALIQDKNFVQFLYFTFLCTP